jgi:ATP-dependent DNA ligase
MATTGPDRYPWIVQGARKFRLRLDGEAVVDGISASAFNALQSRNHEAQFCAFNILVEGDGDLRRPPLHMRKEIGSALGGAIVTSSYSFGYQSKARDRSPGLSARRWNYFDGRT